MKTIKAISMGLVLAIGLTPALANARPTNNCCCTPWPFCDFLIVKM